MEEPPNPYLIRSFSQSTNHSKLILENIHFSHSLPHQPPPSGDTAEWWSGHFPQHQNPSGDTVGSMIVTAPFQFYKGTCPRAIFYTESNSGFQFLLSTGFKEQHSEDLNPSVMYPVF